MNKRTSGLGGVMIVILAILSVIFGVDLFSEDGAREDGAEGSVDNSPEISTHATSANWYDIYFTNPTCPPEAERTGGIDETIAADLLTAVSQVDVAAFDLDAPPIVEALITLEQRQVVVRVVTDTDNADQSAIRRLRRSGISVVEDDRSGLMHNKFIVIDGRIVWMGAMNLTTNDVYCNNNNIVRLESAALAANYTAEMAEMYDDGLFGTTSPDNTPDEQLTIDGTAVENYFSSEKDVALVIANAVARAQDEILFMAFSFTESRIGDAMLDRVAAGVSVQGVFETTGGNTEYSYYPTMNEQTRANLDVRLDGNSRNMHHKVIVIDRETVIFGSFNFSDSANSRNDENLLIVHDATFAEYFIEEFNTVWAEGNPSS